MKNILELPEPEIALKPCPFCGAAAEFYSVRKLVFFGAWEHIIRCTRECTYPFDYNKSKAVVAALWNTRIKEL